MFNTIVQDPVGVAVTNVDHGGRNQLMMFLCILDYFV